ncbi:MAG: DUF2202 domain-containing protein [Rhodococcus sp. (in: high G+C Gram-positive bacteria)]|uniref:DUF2202 domain-containing protein n=1 Tax=Rhodococcus sp. TaxID=1831 RepID=UPI003BB0AE8C
MATVSAQPTPVPPAGQSLSEEERTDLTLMREEERVARDLYRQFHDAWQAQIFDHISTSEQRHYDAVGGLLEQYGVPDPSDGLAVGVYADPQLQQQYDAWLAQGLATVEAAYAVGAELEAADISGLTTAIEVSDEDAIDRVYEKLRRGTENHLRAFEGAASGEQHVGGDRGHRAGQGHEGQGRDGHDRQGHGAAE